MMPYINPNRENYKQESSEQKLEPNPQRKKKFKKQIYKQRRIPQNVGKEGTRNCICNAIVIINKRYSEEFIIIIGSRRIGRIDVE